MTSDPPPPRSPPPEPVLPRLLVLEIGARPDRRRRAVGMPLIVVALALAMISGVGVVGVGLLWATTRPSPPLPPVPSGRVAPGTPADPVEPVVLQADAPPADPLPEKPPARPRLPKPDPPGPGTPGRLIVEGEAVVELQGEFGGFRAGTPLPPGDYAVWADFGEGLVDTGVHTTAIPGRTVTVVCVVEHHMCAIVP